MGGTEFGSLGSGQCLHFGVLVRPVPRTKKYLLIFYECVKRQVGQMFKLKFRLKMPVPDSDLLAIGWTFF